MLRRLLYSPFLSQLVVIRRCNLSCGYCNEFDDVSDPVPTEELKRRIEKIRELGSFAIELTGGEPMMHPDIADLVAHAKRQRFRKVMMISNAFLLNEKKVEALNAAGLDDMQVSVDGVEPNDVTVKVLKPLRPKLEMLARTAKFRVTLSGVIGSSSSREVLEVIAFAKSHGMRPRVLLIHSGDGQLRLNEEERELYKRVKQEIGGRYREAGDYRSRLLATGSAPFRCRSGSRYLYVDEFGIVRWCSQQMHHFGIKLADYTHDDLRRQFHTKKGCEDKCTIGCSRSTSAPDEWRSQKLAPTPSPFPAEKLVRIQPSEAARKSPGRIDV
jgi:MoaA/NifB/PqqE/SkfB family radical SAM enzyme